MFNQIYDYDKIIISKLLGAYSHVAELSLDENIHLMAKS